MSGKRLSIPEYAMALAEVASLRSEDPFRKVGAAALDWDNRVIATAYNGLAPGFDAPSGFGTIGTSVKSLCCMLRSIYAVSLREGRLSW